MRRLKFEWYCKKNEKFSQWEIPCGCDRNCEHLTKVSPYRGVFGKIRDEIFERDGECLKCGRKNKFTIDHIVPISKGGNNEKSNLQILCERCNSLKGDSIIDYRK
jgi:5-methylcytosine-specific restriction endonuclease McrA